MSEATAPLRRRSSVRPRRLVAGVPAAKGPDRLYGTKHGAEGASEDGATHPGPVGAACKTSSDAVGCGLRERAALQQERIRRGENASDRSKVSSVMCAEPPDVAHN